MPQLSPAYDNKIARKYCARTVEHKMENKKSLQDQLGWIVEPKQPIVCISTGMSDVLGGTLLENVVDGILELPVALLIRGRGSTKYGELFTNLAKGQGHRMKIVGDDEVNVRRLLAGSDIAMFFAPPQEPDELANALRYGVIPVSLPHELLEDYNPVQESGNSFVYEEATHWQCFAALVRALETFKFPHDWRTIQRNGMEAIEKRDGSK